MRINPLNNVSFGEIEWVGGTFPDKVTGKIESKKHPLDITVTFHDNGRPSEIEIDYQTPQFQSTVREQYDKNGRNINYNA